MRNLARVNTSLDLDSLLLTVKQGNPQVAAAQLADAGDRAKIESFFWQLLPTLPRAAGFGSLAPADTSWTSRTTSFR